MLLPYKFVERFGPHALRERPLLLLVVWKRCWVKQAHWRSSSAAPRTTRFPPPSRPSAILPRLSESAPRSTSLEAARQHRNPRCPRSTRIACRNGTSRSRSCLPPPARRLPPDADQAPPPATA